MESKTEPQAAEQPVSNDADCSIASLRSFEDAFDSHCCGCRRECECGTIFWDSYNDGYDWDDGEREALEANPNARSLRYSVGTIILDGREYVMDCDCWKKKAARIIGWLTQNAREVATFLNLEKKRKLQEAGDLVSVD